MTMTLRRLDTDPMGQACVEELFSEPDFYFRTRIPDLLCSAEVEALVPKDTLLWRDGPAAAGLVWVEEPGAGYPGHVLLYARFAAAVDDATAAGQVEDVLRAFAETRPLHRVTYLVCAGDGRGVRLAEALGLDLEGAVPEAVALGDQRYALNYYGRLYQDAPHLREVADAR